MKQHFLLIAGFSILLTSSYAQLIITPAYAPAAREVSIRSLTDTSSLTEGSAGASQTWNFSTLTELGTDTTIYLDAATTKYYSSFPTATHAISQAGNGYVYFEDNSIGSTGTLKALGVAIVFDSTLHAVRYKQQPTIMKFPSTYLNSFKDTSWYDYRGYLGQDVGGTQVDSFRTYHKSWVEVDFDAYGTVISPAGTFTNCLREKRQEISTDSAFGYIVLPFVGGTWVEDPNTPPTTDTTITYTWYAENVKNPIVVINYRANMGLMEKMGIGYIADTSTVKIPAAPIAKNDTVELSENASVSIEVQLNDIKTSTVKTEVFDSPKHGTHEVIDETAIYYIADSNYVGKDSLMYSICDIYDQCTNAKVIISISAPPVSSVNSINASDFKVFPNPASGKLNINSSITGRLELYDFTGRKIDSFNIFNNSIIDVSSYVEGIYIYKIYSSKGIIKTGKLSIIK